jgi:AraC-like DNA-binding protein
MQYREFLPHMQLQPYIDAYWRVVNEDQPPGINRILPDGCVDLIFNLGEDFSTDTETFVMQNEKVYLVGTMTRYKQTVNKPGTYLLGIRFKPGGFTHFFRHASLVESTDKTIEFDKRLLPHINATTQNIIQSLDRFFLQKFTRPRNSILPVITDITQRQGQISVESLARVHFITLRQLERCFKEHTGLSPKKFVNFVRYQFALKTIQTHTCTKSLADIAFDYGYYDHSHLTNEVKKYSGLLPSEL